MVRRAALPQSLADSSSRHPRWHEAAGLHMIILAERCNKVHEITIELIAGWADWNIGWYCTYYIELGMHAIDCNCMYNICRHVYTLVIYIIQTRIYVSGPPRHLLQICTSPATLAPAVHQPQVLISTHSLLAIICGGPREWVCACPSMHMTWRRRMCLHLAVFKESASARHRISERLGTQDYPVAEDLFGHGTHCTHSETDLISSNQVLAGSEKNLNNNTTFFHTQGPKLRLGLALGW